MVVRGNYLNIREGLHQTLDWYMLRVKITLILWAARGHT